MPHEDQIAAFRLALDTINLAEKLGLSNAMVNSATSVATLKTAILGLSVHEDQKKELQRIANTLDMLKAADDLTDAEVNGATTVAQLRAAIDGGHSEYGRANFGE